MNVAPRTVAVTGASGHIARDLIPALLDAGHLVLALTTGEAAVSDGAVAVRRWTETPAGRAALAEADVVVNTAGRFAAPASADYAAANVLPARTIAESVRPGTRIIHLSAAHPAAGDANAYRDSKGRAEAVLRAADAETVIFRPDLVLCPATAPCPFETRLRHGGDRPVVVLGPPHRRLRPIAAADVRAALLTAVAGLIPAGRWDLAGPDEMTMRDVVRLINGRDVPTVFIRHEHLERLPSLPAATLDYLERWNEQPALDPAPLARLLGGLRPVRDTWTAAVVA